MGTFFSHCVHRRDSQRARHRVRERERERRGMRETQTEKKGERERQTDRERRGMRESQTDRQTEKKGQRERQTEREREGGGVQEMACLSCKCSLKCLRVVATFRQAGDRVQGMIRLLQVAL